MMGGRSNSCCCCSCWGWRRWRWWRGAWTWTDSSSVSSLFQESEDADPCRASCHVSQHQAGHALVFIAALLKFSSQLDAAVTHSSVTTSRSVSALLNSKRWNINTPPLPCVPRPSLRAGSFYGRSEEAEAPSGTRTCSLFNAPPQGEILQQLQLPVGAAGIVIFKRCQSWDITGGRLSGGLLGRTPAATPAELLGRTSRTSRSARVNKHTGRSRQRSPPSGMKERWRPWMMHCAVTHYKHWHAHWRWCLLWCLQRGREEEEEEEDDWRMEHQHQT